MDVNVCEKLMTKLWDTPQTPDREEVGYVTLCKVIIGCTIIIVLTIIIMSLLIIYYLRPSE